MKRLNSLSRAEMKKIMGGYDVSVQCTYHFWNGTVESGNVTVPGGYGSNPAYAFAHQFAEDFCAHDPSCAFVDCGH